MASKKRPSASQYPEAEAWFRARTPIQKAVWRMLKGKAQRQAFTVAGVAQLDLIAQVQTSLLKAIHDGQSMQTWKKAIRKKLEAEWAGTVANPSARLDNIFRTNCQLAYGQGRRMQMLEPEVLRYRPFWRYVAVLDTRTTKFICRPLNGVTLPAHDRFWRSHQPPLHFQCRSVIQSLSPAQMKKKGGLTDDVPRVPAQPGFGNADPEPYQPQLSKYPPNLAYAYEKKERQRELAERDTPRRRKEHPTK